VFGNLEADRNAMFLEAINQVLQIWASEPPYNLQGQFWNISVQKTLIEDIGQGFIPRPLQRPHPPIVVTAVAPFSKGVTEAAARGWEPISANFLMPAWVKSHWPKYVRDANAPAALRILQIGALPRACSSPRMQQRRRPTPRIRKGPMFITIARCSPS
jgi:alkanesulfonate monooxygenase SsuD/methylene tetrahydromethanopterin reductase-like flavin-dependent oxidoreductase (luciferase family)